MKPAILKLDPNGKITRQRDFLEQVEQVVPLVASVELVASYCPEGRTGRPPFSLMTMLLVHFMQQWFALADPATSTTSQRQTHCCMVKRPWVSEMRDTRAWITAEMAGLMRWYIAMRTGYSLCAG